MAGPGRKTSAAQATAGDASCEPAPPCGAAPRESTTECIGEVSGLCRALSDPHGVRILGLLTAQQHEVCVCDLATRLDRSQPNALYHLKKLEEAGLLDRRANSEWAYCTPTAAAIDALVRLERVVSPCGLEPDNRRDTRRVVHAS